MPLLLQKDNNSPVQSCHNNIMKNEMEEIIELVGMSTVLFYSNKRPTLK